METGDVIQGVVDEYTVDEIVGEGGFGVTYRARRASNGESVALKQMRIERAQSWKALELFEREAAVLKSLSHPRIPAYVEFFASGEDGPIAHAGGGETAPSSLVLVQQLVEGVDLARRLGRGERFEPTQVTEIVRSILEVLTYLHELSPPVIHRDVNPRNIVLDENNVAHLVDFGAIQQRIREATVGGSTSVGTLGYIPIEQSLGKARPASDLYALAVTTVVLATGLQPEELPLDEDSSKIDLAELGLDKDGSENRKHLLRFLDLALEPIAGSRLASARAGLEILDGKDSLDTPKPTQLADPDGPSWVRTVFLLFLGGSLGSAGIIYPLNFDNFSETQLVEMAPFWVLPAAFGAIGLTVWTSPRPFVKAFVGTVLAALGLALFLFGIFPAL